MDSHNLVILHLSLIEGIGSALIDAIVSAITASQITDLYSYTIADCVNILGVSLKQAQKIVDGLQNYALLEQELSRIEKHNISWVTGYDEQYPVLLKQIHLYPAVIYIQGALPDRTQKGIAVVGSRNANEYGKKVIDYLIKELVGYEYAIISGGALGADAMAHEAAMRHNGSTIAVLGSGLLNPYPRSHTRLFKDIASSGGAVISAFSLDSQALAGNFPARNRIIAGLSTGCLVIQAAEKSGAKITAQFALDQGKPVFAVPGPIDDPLSIGCHQLIKEGALLVDTIDDILEELEQGYQRVATTVPVMQKNDIKHDDTPKGRILFACRTTPQTTDDLLIISQLALFELNILLFEMQIEGVVMQNRVGLWQTVG